MTLQKTPIDISFAGGLDLKSDPKRVPIGKFLSLVNSVFTKQGLLQKRNGFASFPSLPSSNSQYITTFNDDLTAIGTQIYAFSESTNSWVSKSTLFPCKLSVLPLIRSSTNQTQCDAVILNGLICTVFTDQNPSNTVSNIYKYTIADSATGQNIIAPTQITEANSIYSSPRVYTLGMYFIIMYIENVTGNYHLRYIAVSSTNPNATVIGPADIQSGLNPGNLSTSSFDALNVNGYLYIAYSETSGGQALQLTYMNNPSTGVITFKTFTGWYPQSISICADSSNVYYSFFDFNSGNVCFSVTDFNLNTVVSPNIISSSAQCNIASTAISGTLTQFIELVNNYSGTSIPTHYIVKNIITVSPIFHSVFVSGTGSITASSVNGLVNGMVLIDNTTPSHITSGTTFTISGTTLTLSINTAGNSAVSPGDALIGYSLITSTLIRSLGLASKAFLYNGISYMAVAYNSTYQPSLFLMDGNGNIIAKWAYSNAGNLILSGTPYLYSLPNYSFNITTMGTIVIGSNMITSVLDTMNIEVGMSISSNVAGIPAGSKIEAIQGNTIIINSVATASFIGAILLVGNVIISYLIKDSVAAINKNTSPTQAFTNNPSAIYSQSGVNSVNILLGTSNVSNAEAASTLNISGGFVWEYEGYTAVEQNFFVWPDYIALTYTADSAVTPTGTFTSGSFTITVSSISGIYIGMTITDTSNSTYIPANTQVVGVSGSTVTINKATTHLGTNDNLSIQGNVPAQTGGSTQITYFYQVIYSWTDNQGNTYKSAPSIPVSIVTTGSTTDGMITLVIDTLRVTYKQNVKIEIYRWSTQNQIYYEVTSVQQPTLNSITQDTITFHDVYNDTDTFNGIVGNSLIYTNGGVLENISPPATNILTLFQSRMWLVDAEDPNLLWFSKPIIENTPIEFSDLLTYFVSPTVGAQGSTGSVTAMAPMDDKFILFKQGSSGVAMYYVNGTGPDITGANSQLSEPTFITSALGSDNQQSIVFIPTGLIFQSDKGLWLLGRDLSTSYIGAPVETLVQGARVLSAVNVPDTTQVRFTLDSGIIIMYDYFYNAWSSFEGVPSPISSTIYKSYHTILNSFGEVLQETPDTYLDGTNPVLMSFTTSYISLAGIQGLERFYFFYILGEYITPFKLDVKIAYDFNPSPTQSELVTPQTYSPPWGVAPFWGSERAWGGNNLTFKERVFPSQQKCSSFQLQIQEIYDPSYGLPSGEGLSISGLNIIVGVKRGFRTQSTGKSSG